MRLRFVLHLLLQFDLIAEHIDGLVERVQGAPLHLYVRPGHQIRAGQIVVRLRLQHQLLVQVDEPLPHIVDVRVARYLFVLQQRANISTASKEDGAHPLFD